MPQSKKDNFFHPRTSVSQVEEGFDLAPRFDENGLLTCVTTDYHSGLLLMVGYMNAEALKISIKTLQAHYWSRSRKCLWHKGATSGMIQKIHEILIDDDQDALWLRVSIAGIGASCHVGYKSCFYRRLAGKNDSKDRKTLEFVESKKLFDPKKVYKEGDEPTIL